MLVYPGQTSIGRWPIMGESGAPKKSQTDKIGLRQHLQKTVDKVLTVQQPVVERHVARTRRRRWEAAPDEVIEALERQYLATVPSTGAAVGGSAAAPGVGAGVAMALSVGEVATFLEASLLFTLSVAEIHGVEVQDVERRRTLLLAVLLGDNGVKIVEKAAERTGKYWGRHVTEKIPIEIIRRANKVLGQHFITKYGTKHGIIVIGRLAPFGIGAAIGGGGNALLGTGVTRAARRAFGPPPDSFGTPTPTGPTG